MLEKIANRRIANTEEGEKITVGLQLFNSLTALGKYSAEGVLIRRKQFEAIIIIKIKNIGKKALQKKAKRKIFVKRITT